MNMSSTYVALEAKNNEYCTQRKTRSATLERMHRLGWEVDELQRLLDDCQWILRELNQLKFADSHENVPRRLTDLRQKMKMFVKGIVPFQHTSASHIAVYMVSDERRAKKPYAIPIQCVPYRGMNEGLGRRLVKTLVSEMHRRGMCVSGNVVKIRIFC